MTHGPLSESASMIIDKLVLHSGWLAKYLAAFFRMSRSSSVRRSCARSCSGSVFRLIVRTALIERDALDCATWDDGHRSTPREVKEREQPLERTVSWVIGAMPFLWLSVGDVPDPKSLRGSIERNAIALLSNYGKAHIDPPSVSWLGNHCTQERVIASGLWNSNHVSEEYDPAFLDTFASLFERMQEPD